MPEIAQVLVQGRIGRRGQSATFQFRAPTTPGDYPYLCTYPNHWRIMNGVLHVGRPDVAEAGRRRRHLRPLASAEADRRAFFTSV